MTLKTILFGVVFGVALVVTLKAFGFNPRQEDPEMGLMQTVSILNSTHGTILISCQNGEERIVAVRPGEMMKSFPFSCGR